MRLLLIRHGQTPSNVAGALDTGFPGAGLTPLGKAQAERVPGALADLPVAGVYASVLVRTQLTAGPLAAARGLDVQVREGLEEVSAGEVEMCTDEAAVRTYVETVNAWAHGDLQRCMPGGHDGEAFLERYDAALQAIAMTHEPDDTVAVVSHGAAIRLYATLRAVNTTPDDIARRLANTGLAVLDSDSAGRLELTDWRAEPLGGVDLLDQRAHDITGESAEEAVADAE